MKGKRDFGKAILAAATGITLISLVVGCPVIRDLASRPYLFGPGPESKQAGDPLTTSFLSNVRLGKHNVESIYGFACYLQQRKEHQLALHEFQKILHIDPCHVKAYNGMGVSYDMLGQYAEAVHCYRKALELNPNLDYVHNNLGYSYLLQGDTQSAMESFQQAIALNGQKDRYKNNLHLAQERNRSHDVAGRVLEGSPDQPFEPSGIETALEGSGIWLPRAPAHTSHSASLPDASAGSMDITLDLPPLQLEISNGNGVNRMARMVGEFLVEKGLEEPRLTNAEHFEYEKTVIYYRDGLLRAASDVASYLPGWQDMARVEHFDRPMTGVRVLLGKDLVRYKASFFTKSKTSRKSS